MIHNPGFVLSHCDIIQFNSEIDDLMNCNSYQWFNIICKWFRSLQIRFRVLFLRRHRNGEDQLLGWRTFSNTVICWVYTSYVYVSSHAYSWKNCTWIIEIYYIIRISVLYLQSCLGAALERLGYVILWTATFALWSCFFGAQPLSRLHNSHLRPRMA